MKPNLKLGAGKGSGKLIRIAGAIPGLELLGDPLPSGFEITLETDRKDLLEGNLLLIGNRRYWIAAREPSAPDPANRNVKIQLRADTSTRKQRQRSLAHARRTGEPAVKLDPQETP